MHAHPDRDQGDMVSIAALWVRGAPVFAIDTRRRRDAAAGLARLQGFTPKRRAFYALARAAVRVGYVPALETVPVTACEKRMGFDLLQVRSRLAEVLQTQPAEITPTVVWPWPRSQQGERLYIHWLAPGREPVAFTKLALTEADARRLEREAHYLRLASQQLAGAASTPELLAHDAIGHLAHLSMTPVPSGAAPVRRQSFPAHVIRALQAHRVSVIDSATLVSRPWFNDLLSERRLVALASQVQLSAQGGLSVAPAHGDFEPKNMMLADYRIWLVDWELATDEAPLLVDRVRYVLATSAGRRRDDRGDLRMLLARAQAEAWSSSPLTDVAAALAFLTQNRCPAARRISVHWEGA